MRLAPTALVLLAAACRPTPGPPAPPAPPAPRAVAADAAVAPTDALRAAAAPPAPDPALRYELARLTAEAKRDLGVDVRVHVLEGRWVLLGAPGLPAARFERAVVLAQAALTAYFNGRFRTPPPHALAVYLFPEADDYQAYCRARLKTPCASRFGFYLAGQQRLIMNAGLGLGTLTHELVHPILAADFPGAPLWLNEGIASLYEAPVLERPGEIHGTANWRLPRLRAALAAPAERPRATLGRLFGLSDDGFRDRDEELHYAQARYLCQWLDARGLLWRFYHLWRDGVGADPRGERAFRAVVGLGPAEAQPRFEEWLRSL